jgi:DNA-binding transcriptional LysR family regulator
MVWSGRPSEKAMPALVVARAANPASARTLAGTSLTSVLREFARRHPGVDLTLRTATSREVSDLVRRAEVNLGLRYSEDPAPDLRCEPLYA